MSCTFKLSSLIIDNGIQTSEEVLLVAEILDHPDNSSIETTDKCYDLLEKWILRAIHPDHPQHELLNQTIWRSYSLQVLYDEILTELEVYFDDRNDIDQIAV